MAGSIVEREIRNSVIDKIRQLRPDSRIIHELNTNGTGSCRADIAAIGIEEILMFEIKSERDKLARLTKQQEAFKNCSHKFFIVLDKKFFKEKVYSDDRKNCLEPNLELETILGSRLVKDHIWHYPEPLTDQFLFDHSWKIEPRRYGQNFFPTPNTRAMLNLLWAEELREVCRNLVLPYLSKDNMMKLIERIILGATGRHIVQQVCLMLRKRRFAEADDGIEV